VDDNPANVKLLRVFLDDEGYAVREASDAPAVLAALRDFEPRLILMDVNLPGMDGLELTRLLRADPLTRDVVILGLTAYAMEGDRERVLAAGCDGYFAKPLDLLELRAALTRYLRP
jgi:two-component system cell cycle response regulator DivK